MPPGFREKKVKTRGQTTKTCRKCGETKRKADFPPMRKMRDGRSSWCRPCHAGAVRRSHAKAKARDLLKQASLEERLANVYGEYGYPVEWRRRKAASLREEAEEILRSVSPREAAA